MSQRPNSDPKTLTGTATGAAEASGSTTATSFGFEPPSGQDPEFESMNQGMSGMNMTDSQNSGEASEAPTYNAE